MVGLAFITLRSLVPVPCQVVKGDVRFAWIRLCEAVGTLAHAERWRPLQRDRFAPAVWESRRAGMLEIVVRRDDISGHA